MRVRAGEGGGVVFGRGGVRVTPESIIRGMIAAVATRDVETLVDLVPRFAELPPPEAKAEIQLEGILWLLIELTPAVHGTLSDDALA